MPRKKIVEEPSPTTFSFGFKFKLQKRESLDTIKMVNTDTRNAFYNLELMTHEGGYKVMTSFGKIGNNARTMVIAKGDEDTCRRIMNKRYNEKLAKGYRMK